MSQVHRTVDLHMHSTASDGLFPPAEVVARAHAAGLVAIALTDHDTIDGLPAARDAASGTGLRVIAGVELSAMDDEGDELHLLGLHVDDLTVLEAPLAGFRRMRATRADRMIAQLETVGATITRDAVGAIAAGGVIGRPHVARALVQAKHARDLRDAFDRFIGYGRPGYVAKEHFALADAIALVHEAGGLAVWAHPGSNGSSDRVQALAALGLDGVEVFHPSHSTADIERLAMLADAFGLVTSGGSDWHGTPDPSRQLNCMRVPAVLLSEQDARVTARRATAAATPA
ncbi:MAG: PHP domain-containing protein [Gemmatimonadaceae bacterium]|nr:PHP domain-containing protein [Gemmatimonadaceae bacterium]